VLTATKVTSPVLTVLTKQISDRLGRVKVFTSDPWGVTLDGGETLLTVTFSVDAGAPHGRTNVCPRDTDGDFDFEGHPQAFCWEPQCGSFAVGLGDLDCDGALTGTDVLVQAGLVVDLFDCADLPPCIPTCDNGVEISDWDCSGTLTGTDVLIGSSIVVDTIALENTPLGQGCP
jgi:hypothetical protein